MLYTSWKLSTILFLVQAFCGALVWYLTDGEVFFTAIATIVIVVAMLNVADFDDDTIFNFVSSSGIVVPASAFAALFLFGFFENHTPFAVPAFSPYLFGATFALIGIVFALTFFSTAHAVIIKRNTRREEKVVPAWAILMGALPAGIGTIAGGILLLIYQKRLR